MKALLLAGGEATRLHPFTKTRSKPMLPIANETILQRNLRSLGEAGINSVVIVTSPGEQMIPEAIGNGSELGMHVEYVQQKKAGIAEALSAARGKFVSGQYFMLVYADILTTKNIFSNILSVFNRFRAPVASVCLTNEPARFYGNVYLDDEMKITRIVEKPADSQLGNYVLGGVFMMPYEIFDFAAKGDGEMLAALDKVNERYGMYAAVWESEWIDINYPWSILQANRMMMDTICESHIAADVEISTSISISGPVVIGKGVRIREGAVIRGPAVIGDNCFIGNNALVREYCALGPDCDIGFGTELKNSVIFGKAKIGRISYLGDSVVGEGAHIGSGTMTINFPITAESVMVPIRGKLHDSGLQKLGAFIGDNALIGASNTIQAGAVIDCNALIRDHFTVDRGDA